MVNTVNEFLKSLKVDAVQTHKNLQLHFLVSEQTKEREILTVDEAFQAGVLEITEVKGDGGGEVPFLRFVNKGIVSILVLEGMIVQGNLQNRTVRHSFILLPERTVLQEVFCVQAGRWGGRKNATSSQYHVYSDLRKLNISKKSRQNDTWNSISEKFSRMNCVSESEAVDDLFQDYDAVINEYKKSFSCKPEHIGMIAVLNGNPLGLDCFGIEKVFQKQFDKLLSGIILDAIDNHSEDNKDVNPYQFLEAVRAVKKEAGESEEIRFETKTLIGSALLSEKDLIHVEVFAQ
jgi:hypothetical protein